MLILDPIQDIDREDIEESTDLPILTEKEIKKMKVKDLKKCLKERRLNDNGLKSELFNRILEFESERRKVVNEKARVIKESNPVLPSFKPLPVRLDLDLDQISDNEPETLSTMNLREELNEAEERGKEIIRVAVQQQRKSGMEIYEKKKKNYDKKLQMRKKNQSLRKLFSSPSKKIVKSYKNSQKKIQSI